MFYKMTKDGKRIAPVQNKPKKAAVVEVKKGGAAKQRLTIWSVNQYSIRILANISMNSSNVFVWRYN